MKMSGGGKPGRCTGESGVKSFEEIEKEVKDNKITPTYDTTTRAYWYNYVCRRAYPPGDYLAHSSSQNGDFITYDKTESWNYKTQIAKDHCFGGTFIWSLDQGIPNTSVPVPVRSLESRLAETCSWVSVGPFRRHLRMMFGVSTPSTIRRARRARSVSMFYLNRYVVDSQILDTENGQRYIRHQPSKQTVVLETPSALVPNVINSMI